MNLNWINKLIKELPEISPIKKNLIEIAGYPKWENVNSNLLAFYFDEKEEHGFNRLFLNSLIDLYESKINVEIERELFETYFTVDREVSTQRGVFIDIVIKDEPIDNDDSEHSSWSIIIENKLYASLYNNLSDYSNSIESDFKFGIVLSVNPISIDKRHEVMGGKYVNILHNELVEKVKQNLSDYYLESNDLHLLFLKEYISNINSFYRDNYKFKDMDTALHLFHTNKVDIEILKKKDMQLLRHISKIVINIMEDRIPSTYQKGLFKNKVFSY